ncbi:hypothetical protein QEN19_000151 [Hanseniaspora menglaensis]
MTDTVRKFFTKSLKSAATSCNNGQLTGSEAATGASQLGLVSKNNETKSKPKKRQNYKGIQNLNTFTVTGIAEVKKKINVVPFPKPLYNANLTTYTDNNKLKEMLFKGTDVSPYRNVGKINSYEINKSKHLANLMDRENLKKLHYDLLMNKKFAFINFQPSQTGVEDKKLNEESDFIFEKLQYIVAELKAMEQSNNKQMNETFNEDFLMYIRGVDNTGGCNSIGLNFPSNEEDAYKQFSFKNRYGATLPLELVQLKNYLPEISIGCYSMEHMGYDKDWFEFAKLVMSDMKLKNEIINKLELIKYRATEAKYKKGKKK